VAQAASEPIIVVTGGNRGIGFEICRQLATRGARVVLTARKPAAGDAAVKKLAAQKLTVAFHPLDVTDSKSVIALHDFLKDTYGHIDVLISNAGIIAKGAGSISSRRRWASGRGRNSWPEGLATASVAHKTAPFSSCRYPGARRLFRRLATISDPNVGVRRADKTMILLSTPGIIAGRPALRAA
jgi:NAD(P)-dependent dehydrogenase (short-subunit alcohol dehydrogenase family)